jgi:FAD/FMN-containing dehydrogenase
LQGSLSPADGVVLVPGSAAYAQRRRGFNLRCEAAPAGILLCRTEAAVQGACTWSREEGIPVHLRAGGHSYEGYNNGPGLLIDLSPMDGVAIDAATGTATVGAGVRQGPLQEALARAGWVMAAGTCPTVGTTGLTLGGGYGPLSRQIGLACDNLQALRLVDAQGETLSVSAEAHPDLYWASRGGGGGHFGAVTALELRLHRAAHVTTIVLRWPGDAFAEVLATWQAWAPQAPPALTCRLVADAAHDRGITSVTAKATWFEPSGGATPDPPPEALAPLFALAPVEATRRRQPVEAWAESDPASQPPVRFKAKSDYAVAPLDARDRAALARAMATAAVGDLSVIFGPGGGAVGAVPADATAYAHRDHLFSVQYYTAWASPDDTPAHLAGMRALHAAARPCFSGGAYVNYLDADLEDWPRAYYGANLERLRRVKAAYDPEVFFHSGPQALLPG